MTRIRTSAWRWSIASRTVAATIGGYALVSLILVAVPVLLGAVGVNRPQAVLAATMASFLVYAAIIMAVFHARSATRAWAWLTGAAVLLGLVTWLLWPGAHA